MQRKNRAAAVAAVCLAAVCAGGAVSAAAASPGSQSDPLVTLSYLTETVTPSLLSKVDETVAANEQALVDKLNRAIDSYSKQMEELLSQGGNGTSDAFAAATVPAGKSLKMEAGCEVMLRAGSAVYTGAASDGLIDTTAGTALHQNESLVQNHLYMAAAGGSIKASAACTVLVRGTYLIS